MSRYYPVIVQRLADPGVSVRKRVIKILRDVCVSRDAASSADAAGVDAQSPARSPRALTGAQRQIDACCRLVARLGPHEEEEVHKLILRTFHDLWFAPPAEMRLWLDMRIFCLV